MDSDIGEDNFRMLSDGNDNEDYHAINDELPKELDNSKIYWNAGGVGCTKVVELLIYLPRFIFSSSPRNAPIREP